MKKIMQRKFWLRLQEQKKNNRGSSLVTVLGVMALVTILVIVLMSISMMNFQMKKTNLNSKKNFYTAESALDEIREGLVQQVSDASSEAYTVVMGQYDSLDETERRELFEQEFTRCFATMSDEGSGFSNVNWYDNSDPSAPKYNPEALEGFLRETRDNATVTAPAGANAVNLDKAGIILKNVTVTYTDIHDYETQIQTDIVLQYPNIDFTEMPAIPNLLNYALVANDTFAVSAITGNNEITGNVYWGQNGAEINNASVTLLCPEEETNGSMAVTNGALTVANGGSLTLNGVNLWARDLVADSARIVTDDGASGAYSDLYLKNDVVLTNTSNTSTEVAIKGGLYAYGNINTAGTANSILENVVERDDVLQNPAMYSSSVIVNGTHSTLDMSGLTGLMIAGNAYVNGNNSDVLMGESVALKADQLAYLIPPECVAPKLFNGGSNPMSSDRYEALMAEWMDNPDEKLIDYTMSSGRLSGMTLSELGVSDYQLQVFPVNDVSLGSMVYLFMKFDTASAANNFFQKYYQNNANLTTLGKMLDLYTGTGIKLPADITEQTMASQFYFNGNILADAESEVFVPDRLSVADQDAELREELAKKQTSYQDTFHALGRKLITDYAALTQEEKQQDVYGNLVNAFDSYLDVAYMLAPGGSKSFISENGEAAIVVNGDYSVDANALMNAKNIQDKAGNTHNDAKLHVVIASGNVTVSENFDGMIIAGGNITIENRAVTIKADPRKAGCALRAKNADGVRAADYLINGDHYIMGGGASESDDVETDSISMSDCVVYENWKKQ